MIRFTPIGLALLLFLGCSSGPTEPQALCLAVVNVDGVLFTSPGTTAAPEDVSEPHLTVTLNTGCLDQGEPSVALQSGESNFLPVGTTLRGVAGFEVEARLVYWSDVLEEWLVLSPVE